MAANSLRILCFLGLSPLIVRAFLIVGRLISRSEKADNPLSYQQGQRQQQWGCYYFDYQYYDRQWRWWCEDVSSSFDRSMTSDVVTAIHFDDVITGD